MPADRAIGATAAVSADVSRPNIMLSPLLIAVLAATQHPAAVPPVSMTSRPGAPSFGNASSAAWCQNLADIRSRPGHRKQDRHLLPRRGLAGTTKA